jgi:hypothetical protein
MSGTGVGAYVAPACVTPLPAVTVSGTIIPFAACGICSPGDGMKQRST